MGVISVDKNPTELTMTITSEFAAPVKRVWQLWADPRQLERWWGPPTHPATFVDYELRPGEQVHYHMTGPDGQRYPGWWRIVEVDAPRRLEFADGFADENGDPNDDLPTTTTVVELLSSDAGTQMVLTSTFPSLEAMEEILAMGAEEGMKLALGQIDGLLTED